MATMREAASVLLLAVMGCGGGASVPAASGGAGLPLLGTGGVARGTGGALGTGGAATGTSGRPSMGGATTGTGGGPGTGGATKATGGVPGTGGAMTGKGGASAAAAGGAGASGTTGGLPEGDNGIAARHPGDSFAGDPEVIFADDFESYGKPADLAKRWDNMYQNQYVGLATAKANVYAGKQALEFTLPQQDAELSDAVEKVVSPELDVLFLRYYAKFQPPYDVVGSSHNGSSISAHYTVNGQSTPGVPADGKNKFLANLENWRGDSSTASPGQLNVYIYHPEQRSQWGDHFFPTGLVMPNTSLPFDFGPDFVARPDIIPELDRWYAYEIMVKANTPGQRDGRIAAWLDGKLVMDFANLRLRDIATLTIDRFALCFHIGSNPNGEGKRWYDNVVAAKAYVGPLAR